MDITRIVAGAILLIFAIWCFMTFPDGLAINVITKCVAGGTLGGFGVILITLGFKKRVAIAVLGAILLTSAIFVAINIPELAVKCITCGILGGLGIVLIALGLKSK